jgi:hypothetical protein
MLRELRGKAYKAYVSSGRPKSQYVTILLRALKVNLLVRIAEYLGPASFTNGEEARLSVFHGTGTNKLCHGMT